jgi:predicted DCC family thiol-disulfide oxidoreductase YuxK
MKLADNGWTGGQYSVFRALFGGYLFVYFVQLAPRGAEMFSNRGASPHSSANPLMDLFPNVLALWDAPILVTALLLTAAGLSVLLVAGLYDRLAAVALWYIWVWLAGGDLPMLNPGMAYVGLLLLAHACLPGAPYGSWARRGQPDPGSDWRVPPAIFLAVWTLMALGYSYSGVTKLASPSWLDGTAVARVLNNPLARPGLWRDALLVLPDAFLRLLTWGLLLLELSFAPLALFRRLRPWLWSAMLLMQLGLIPLIDFTELSLGMVMLHLFTFNPVWLARAQAARTETIFYDGRCGLCHRAVRFVLAEDRAGTAFRFAPLDSDAFRAAIPEGRRAELPDSLVIHTAEGALLVRSTAVLHLLRRLGGLWRLLATLARLVPTAIRDRLYDGLARIRHRLFTAPAEACPLIPERLRARFDH